MMTIPSCSSSSVEEQNPLLVEWETPYGVPPFDKIKVTHYIPAFEAAMAEHQAEIEAIVKVRSVPDFENTILAFDNAGRKLEQVALVFGMLAAADTNPEMQAVEAEMMPRLAVHSDQIMLNELLFARIKEVYDRRKEFGLDAEQLRLTEKTYTEFVRSGALLEGEERER
ncbi:MAG: peptidase M3, partial [Alistipes sp.]|nr:peptidase M3 [Alistipes sp.]